MHRTQENETQRGARMSTFSRTPIDTNNHNTIETLAYLMFPLEGEILHFRWRMNILLHPIHGGGEQG